MSMFKHSLMITLIVVMFAGSTSVHADVTGSFDLDITLIPENTQTEATQFNIDLQSNLVINFTFSGLTFGVDVGFGTTGVEFAILNLNTSLGVLSVFDEFVFATPFYNSSAADPITADEIHPTQDSDGNVNGPAFVKKRITLELNVAGVMMTNLAIFEDVDFPDPFRYINPIYNPNGLDGIPDTGRRGLANQTPTFGFGDVITLQGQTVSGIQITSSTGICVRLEDNVIKKRDWPESVNQACRSSILAGGFTVNPPLMFELEQLSVENVSIAGITIDTEILWRPSRPLSVTSEASFNVLDLADVVITFGSDDITDLTLDMIQIDIESDNVSFSALDVNGDLRFDLLSTEFGITLNPNQSPGTLTVAAVILADTGLVFLEPVLSVTRGPMTYELTTVFDNSAGGTGVAWRFTQFDLSVEAGIMNVEFDAIFGPTGMQQAGVNLDVGF